jgi:isoleucyl-tRNA synthetase
MAKPVEQPVILDDDEGVETSESIDFVKEEEAVLKMWNEVGAFKTQLRLSEKYPRFTFFDGPPFATGLPHYGHILAGTIKDVVTRYAKIYDSYFGI